MSKIGIVTVLYKSEGVLKDFFDTLEEQTYKNFTLYIVDNASPDKSLNEAKLLSKRVSFNCIFLEEKENWGIAKGNNIGIKEAIKDKCEYILLSNNDIVLRPDTIECLLNGMIQYDSSLVVPKIYYYGSNILWQAGGKYNLFRAITPHNGYQEEDKGQYDEARNVDYSSTCFMMIRSFIFERYGYMDEDYFVYYDDSDFVFRCTKIGKERLYYIPNSIIEHKVSFSSQKGSDFYNRMMFRNRVLFIRKRYNRLTKTITLFNLLAYHFIIHPFKMTFKEYITTSKGILEGLKMPKG